MTKRDAFTLIEVLAAVFLTAVVMTVAISFFVQLSDATDAAAAKARGGRNALTVLDRIARDLEGAYLLAKPPELDPLRHPWIFLAESQEGDSASDRIRFVTRSHRPRNLLAHGSDLAVVTYLLHSSETGPGYELLRAVRPGLPDELDAEFPPANDEQFMVVAENVERFGLRFMDEETDWLDEWDASQLEQSGKLPLAVEIEIATRPGRAESPQDFDDFGGFDDLDPTGLSGEERLSYTRRVNLPMRPIDLDAMLQQALEGIAGQPQGEGAEGGAEGADGQDRRERGLGGSASGQGRGRAGQRSDKPPGIRRFDGLRQGGTRRR